MTGLSRTELYAAYREKVLASALDTLKQEERDIVILRYFKGQTLTEISRLTGISYGMVKVKHNRALNALRAQMEKE